MFLEIADWHIPIKSKRVKNSSTPWLTSEIKNLIYERDRLKRITIIQNTESDWTAYKCAGSRVNKFIK